MEPRQQVLIGLGIGILLLIGGIYRGYRRGRLAVNSRIDYGFVLKLIFTSLAFASTIVSMGLTAVFVLGWGLHTDPPGAPPSPLEAFMPNGYAVQYLIVLVIAGALSVFALALIAYLDHTNEG